MTETTPSAEDLAAIAKASQAAGLSAPSASEQAIESGIADEFYFNGSEAAAGKGEHVPFESPLHLITFCVLFLTDGRTAGGSFAFASREERNVQVGRRQARAAAVRSELANIQELALQRAEQEARQAAADAAAEAEAADADDADEADDTRHLVPE